MTTPGSGAGQAHRVGPVRHEYARVAGLSDERQSKTTLKVLPNLPNSPHIAKVLSTGCGTVRLRAWAGTHAESALFVVRGHRSSDACGSCRRRRRSVDDRVVAASTRRATRREITLRGARSLLARPAVQCSAGPARDP